MFLHALNHQLLTSAIELVITSYLDSQLLHMSGKMLNIHHLNRL
jgi:hypothetical protein